jgi:hypothetical protein
MSGGSRWTRNLSLYACIASAVLIVFLAGGVFATFEWQPYQFFEDGARAANALYRQQRQTRPELLDPRRYRGNGVTLQREGAAPGLTLVQGLFAEGVELRLIDLSGQVLHRWRADFHAIWPHPEHVYPASDVPVDGLHYQTHGMALSADGSVIFNFDNLGTVKLDKCGAVVWTVDRRTHHTITPNPDGSFWIPARRDARLLDDRVLLQDRSRLDFSKADGRHEDTLLHVGPDGAVLEEISALKGLLDGRFAAELYDVREISVTDPTHLNDIEVVTAALAAKIPGVEAGDLLVSLRELHMLAILKRRTGAVAWSHVGPWVRQHDVDITPDGMIEVFNNGDARFAVDGVIGSSILRFDPATGAVRTMYPLNGTGHFFTRIMGANQLLPNGNRLITESMAGRLLEVDAAGLPVWEFVQAYDATHAALIQSARRYPPGFFTVRDWSCPSR